jgi:transcriptional regulator with GAF, ATPase, and Fis domain
MSVSGEVHQGVNAYLVQNAGIRDGARFELLPTRENLMGRDWNCHVSLNDPKCSRVHAAIWFENDAWWIADRKSSNGTYVNGQLIDTAQLIDGTEIRLGESDFTFVMIRQSDGGMNEADTSTRRTVVLDQSFNPAETGQYTLDELRKVDLGEDFFLLFQLSVQLLGVEDPDQVIRFSMEQLFQQTKASVAGFLWLSDEGKLKPKVVFPEDQADVLKLDTQLTQRVVKQKRAIRVQHDTNVAGSAYADSICIPLVIDEQVIGAIHLYRQSKRFSDHHFQMAHAMANIMARSLARAVRHASLEAAHTRMCEKSAETSELIGESEPMVQLKSKIARIAKASGCVLIRGESGVGKELVARALHRCGPRASRPMLSVNCAAIPRDLMESQLFGHKKGAFTSADSDHVGLFQRADLGTLFLDEIGELTLEGQAKLLRILEGHPFLPVGGTQEITTDVRVICATNRDLRDFVNDGKFREDLYYRLTVFELVIPPLRERGTDIRRLLDFFFNHFRQQHGRMNLKISDEAMRRLLAFYWPGNVRQLRNVLDSAVVMAEGNEIGVDDLGIHEASQHAAESLQLDAWERKLIGQALDRTGGNVPEAAKLLGLSRATLYRKIEDYGIKRC